MAAEAVIIKDGSFETTTNVKPATPTTIVRSNEATTKRSEVRANKKKNKNKNRATSNKKKSEQKVRATLFGLSSIKRDGDVSVNMMSDFTTVKTSFLLGPLTLKVEKEFNSHGRRELKSATATTAEMYGRLTLRIMHGGAATLHSIKVLQPKQMRIDSADNHDRTREFMWKRSAQIAHMVSQKLTSATRSMLKPAPNKAATGTRSVPRDNSQKSVPELVSTPAALLADGVSSAPAA